VDCYKNRASDVGLFSLPLVDVIPIEFDPSCSCECGSKRSQKYPKVNTIRNCDGVKLFTSEGADFLDDR
jgi:hypothetical protein